MKTFLIEVFITALASIVIPLMIFTAFNITFDSVIIIGVITLFSLSITKYILELKEMVKLSKSNPIFEKVSYQITLHQLNFDALKGIPETLVNIKKLDKIVCKTINQGSTELYLIVFNPYLGESCDCLVFTNKFDQKVKFDDLQNKLTAK